jgi:hypothetical protein
MVKHYELSKVLRVTNILSDILRSQVKYFYDFELRIQKF